MLDIRKVERVRILGSLLSCISEDVAEIIYIHLDILQKGENILGTSTSEIIDIWLRMPEISPR